MTIEAPKKFLVAVDGSEGSSQAVVLASAMAAPLGIPVELVYVFQGGPEVMAGLPGGSFPRADRNYFVPGAVEKMKQEASEYVFQFARESVADKDVVIEETVLSGLPADTLLKHAKGTPGAAIVIGRRGYSGLTGLLLGSVSQRVINKATCPVLIAS